jgi:hypothetical protein
MKPAGLIFSTMNGWEFRHSRKEAPLKRCNGLSLAVSDAYPQAGGPLPGRDMLPRRTGRISGNLRERRMTEEEEGEIRLQLSRLRQEHGDLDAAISAMTDSARSDPIQVQRLKKKKLALKDRIARLEDMLLPDIIA